MVNVALLGTASYKGVKYMDSTQFCGATCHTVMAPEYSAYANSPHSRIACVECHIGPGAPWFVRSKLSGVRQVFAVALATYSRPVPSPVKHLRPARETCEECHWPQKFHGDKFLVRSKYGDDQVSTPAVSVMVLKVGGSNASGQSGIHGRHLDPRVRIRYTAVDAKRQVIPKVTVIEEGGKSVDYVSSELPSAPEDLAAGETREMDCLDCHNRPSHAFELPERAVDQAIAEGVLSRELPFAKKKAVELLRGDPPRGNGAQRIAEVFSEYYRKEHPETYKRHRQQVEAGARHVAAIYSRNVFPEMKVSWGTYPNNIGHEDFLGCFRCHDDSHKAPDGRTITQDCFACHTLLDDETAPKILTDLGLN
jgi:formate-dependent nitrite reductase cytochrome c552 subunit